MFVKRVVLFLVLLTAYGVFFEHRFVPAGGARMDALSPRAREVELAIVENRFADALPIALELEAGYPGEPLTALWLAAIYRGLDRPNDEVRAWERFIALGSQPAEACPELAEARARVDGAALPAFERCAELDSRDPERLIDLGRAYEHAGRPDRALNAYRRAADLDPRHPLVSQSVERLSRPAAGTR